MGTPSTDPSLSNLGLTSRSCPAGRCGVLTPQSYGRSLISRPPLTDPDTPMTRRISLPAVAVPEQDEGAQPELDLRAQIEARVAQRRIAIKADPVVRGAAHLSELAAVPPTAGASRNGRAHHARPTRPSHWRHRLRSLSMLAITLVCVLVLRIFVVATFYIPSASMEPTLHGCDNCEADMVAVDKLSYQFSKVSRADVVVFDRPPLAPAADKELIKRVIGLPGETISGHDGRVFVGSTALNEPYVNPACHGTADFGPVVVPPARYFMMGDNRCNSADSRVFGTIPKSSIVGRAFAVIWPVKHLRWL
jgi:signal peptidase I